MMMVPLVMSSIILGIASGGDPAQLRRLGARIAPYFLATTSVAVVIGAALAFWVEPGSYLELSQTDTSSPPTVAAGPISASADSPLPERIVRLIPTNPLDAVLE